MTSTASMASCHIHIRPLGDRAIVLEWDQGEQITIQDQHEQGQQQNGQHARQDQYEHEFAQCGHVETVRKGTQPQIQFMMNQLAGSPFKGFLDCVAAWHTLTIYYDGMIVREHWDNVELSAYDWVKSVVEQRLACIPQQLSIEQRRVDIPVIYGGSYGEDLAEVAAHCGLTKDEVVALHSGHCYEVGMIGFAPGFPYLSGMSSRLCTPRKATPRLAIPAGSVGIGGEQTGIYSISTPGGWQIIGRTPLDLFRPFAEQPVLLQAGDMVNFVPISKADYERLERDEMKQRAAEKERYEQLMAKAQERHHLQGGMCDD